MKIDNTVGDWGNVVGNEISINFSSGKVGDVTLTILHEVCHAILGSYDDVNEMKAQHRSIYNVEYSYMVALRWVGVEFSRGDITKHERNFVDYINSEVDAYGRDEALQVSLYEILRRWTGGSIPW